MIYKYDGIIVCTLPVVQIFKVIIFHPFFTSREFIESQHITWYKTATVFPEELSNGTWRRETAKTIQNWYMSNYSFWIKLLCPEILLKANFQSHGS